MSNVSCYECRGFNRSGAENSVRVIVFRNSVTAHLFLPLIISLPVFPITFFASPVVELFVPKGKRKGEVITVLISSR